MIHYRKLVLFGFLQSLIGLTLVAQDLDPRAYIRVPVNTNTLIAGYSYTYGDILIDPTVPLENMEATAHSASFGYARSFNLFGLSSQVMAVVPYSWAEASATISGQQQSITRSGLSDSRLRLSVLVLGGPAVGIKEFMTADKKTIVGVSLNISVPTGEFFSDKLINLGANRWSFKPEVALSQPIGKRWLVDIYSGVWLFTTNNSFYPGSSSRSQEALGSFQAHISYNITPRFWVAYNTTWYIGGKSSIDGLYYDDWQNNTRIGLTAVMPVGKSNSIKLAASTGAVVRVGQDFTAFTVGWQHSWFSKESKVKTKGKNT